MSFHRKSKITKESYIKTIIKEQIEFLLKLENDCYS